MRVAIVGTPADRARLRSRLDPSTDVIGEFASLAAVRAAGLALDAILVSADDHQDDHHKDDATASGGGLDGDLGSDLDDAIDEPLTAREIQVLELLAEGLPNKAIATRLGISDQTVKFHVASISSKLGATNRTDAVRRAVRRGLISL